MSDDEIAWAEVLVNILSERKGLYLLYSLTFVNCVAYLYIHSSSSQRRFRCTDGRGSITGTSSLSRLLHLFAATLFKLLYHFMYDSPAFNFPFLSVFESIV